jgi:hypothetical protein
MGLKHRSLIDKINPIFVALTTTAIHPCLLPWNTGESIVLPEFGPGGGAQHKCDTRNINHTVNNPCTDGFLRLEADFHSSSPTTQAKKRDIIHSIVRRSIRSTSTDSAMVQPPNLQSSIDENFLDYVREELIEQPHNSLIISASLLLLLKLHQQNVF